MNRQDHPSNQQVFLAVPDFEADSDFGVDGDGLCKGEIFSLSDQLQLSRAYRNSDLCLKATRKPKDTRAYLKCDKNPKDAPGAHQRLPGANFRTGST